MSETTSTLRRPLITAGSVVLAALVLLASWTALLSRGAPVARGTAPALAAGWVAIGIRAPASGGGPVIAVSVGRSAVEIRPVTLPAAQSAVAQNDARELEALVAPLVDAPMAGAMILDRLALAGLIDTVGGTFSGVDPVIADASGQALANTWRGLVGRLPEDPRRLLGVVVSLGSALRATTGAETVVSWLGHWHATL